MAKQKFGWKAARSMRTNHIYKKLLGILKNK
jgi:hypothetical protein